eukprot:TRINITY_DN913_c1_g1_i2.p1 TRINITY_DN913_c1_g1~~TRINITY_DN913_c1_g1_i2.p1  ORF type:complete len:223 (+),score=48.85 TRINITY_DN913_c1_g1_i2:580-1248(+)
MVDRVANGSVDLALSWTTVTAERMRRVTFTQPYHYLGLRFLVLADSVKVELSSLARPFSNALWALVLASVVVFAGLLHWFEGDDDPNGDFRDAASLSSACVNAIYHAGLTLVQDREYAPVTVEGRVITFGYAFSRSSLCRRTPPSSSPSSPFPRRTRSSRRSRTSNPTRCPCPASALRRAGRCRRTLRRRSWGASPTAPARPKPTPRACRPSSVMRSSERGR